MSKSSGHNIYTLLTVITIIGGSLLGIYMLKPNSVEAFGVKIKKEASSSSSELSYRSLEGNWEMIFDFERCNNPEFANKQFKCFYDIRLFQDGNLIKGTGVKHSESYEGKITRYAKDFPIKIKGEITNEDKLIAKIYEQNSFKEVAGTIEVPLDNAFTYDGVYKGQEGNCDGNIQLKRILPKPHDN